MGRSNHRELIVPVVQAELSVQEVQEFVIPVEDDTIDILEDDRAIDVERT